MKQIITFSLAMLIYIQGNASIVRGMIEEAEAAIKNVMGNIVPSGHNLLNKSANELNLLVQNSYIIFRKDLDKDISRLSNNKQLFLNKLQTLTRQVQAGKSEMVSLVDNIVLDLNSIVGNTLLSNQRIIIKRVEHLNVLEKFEDSYYVIITASSIGFSDNKIFSEIESIEVNNHEIKNFKVSPLTNNQIRLKFEKSELEKYFYSKEIRISHVKINLHYRIKRFIGILGHKKVELTPTFFIYQFPQLAGDITISYRVPVKTWQDVTSEELLFTTPNHHCTRECSGLEEKVPVYPMEIKVPSSGMSSPIVGDKRIVSAINKCVQNSGPCGFAKVITPPFITDNNTRAYSTVKCWSQPVTFRMEAKIQELQVSSETSGKVEIKGKKYNEIFSIKVPDDIISGNLFYKFSSNESEEIILGTETKRLKLLTVLEPKNMSYKEFIYQILRPDLD